MSLWNLFVRAEDDIYIYKMSSKDLEKPIPLEVEVSSAYGSGHELGDAKADYSGAVAKSDETEIRLVKKLDRRILPILWAMYFL